MRLLIQNNRRFITRVATAISALLSTAVTLYALYFLLIGVKYTVVSESPLGTQTPALQTMKEYHAPESTAVGPIIAAGLLLFGLLTGKLEFAWIGFFVLTVFSILFVFGIGGPLIPVVGALAVLLTILQRLGMGK
jgi:hypothetical protein